MARANQMRGLLRVANGLDVRSQVDTAGVSTPITGASKASEQLALDLSGIAGQIGQLADRAAQKEGAVQGALDGLDPEFRPTRSVSIRGEAYDQAGLQVYGTRVKAEIAADLDEVKAANEANPAGLQKAISAKRATWGKNVLPEFKADAVSQIDRTQLSYMREATREQHARIAAEQRAALQENVSNGLKFLSQRAFALGLDPKADETLSAEFAVLQKSLSAKDLTGKPLLDPSAAAKVLASAKSEMTEARLIGAFSRLPSLASKQQFIDGLRADFGASKGLSKEFDLDGMERITGRLDADLRSAKAEHGTVSRAVAQDVADVAKMAEKGFAPSVDQMAGLRARVLASPPEVQAEMAEAERLMQWQASARRWTPAELDTYAAETRKRAENNATPEAVKRVALAEQLANTARQELKSDPLGWADRVGLVKVAPLDFSSADAASASLKARLAQADEVANAYGQKPIVLRPDEKQRLATAAAQGGEATLGITAAIAQAAPERAPQILAEVFDDAPAVAMLGGHVAASGLTSAARDAADGMALRKTTGFKPMAPAANASRSAAMATLGGALSELPKSETAAVALANSIYEVRARRLQLQDFDEPLWQQGLNEVLGARQVQGETYGGVVFQTDNWGADSGAVIVPPNVKAAGFRDLVDSIRIEDFEFDGRPRHDGNAVATTADLRRAKLKSAGDGQYFLSLGDPEGERPDWLLDSSGDKFVLDLKALEPALRKRRGDLFLGGR